MGRDNELPRRLSYIDRFSTPINAIIVSSALSIAFLLLVGFGTIVDASNAAVLTAYLIINIAAINFYFHLKKEKQYEKRYLPAVSAFGILSIIVILAYLDKASLEFVALIALFGIAYYAFKNVKLGKGIDWRKHMAVPRHSVVRLFGEIRNVEAGRRKQQ